MSDSPELLLEKIRKGNKQAEQELVEKYYKGLHYILFQRSSDHELANDIAQETFIVVIKKARLGEIENPSSLSSFVRNVGINLLIAGYRKESRQKTDASDEIDLQIASNSPHIPEQLNSAKVRELVTQMMKELPTDRDRDLLMRYFVYGQDKEEVCQALELTSAHFDRVLHRARSRLKQILQHKFDVEIGSLSISQLLSVVFVASLVSSQQNSTEHKEYTTLVREFPVSSHSIHVADENMSVNYLLRHSAESEV